MARRLRKRYGATTAEALCAPAEALWRDCGSAQARHLRTCYGETPAEAL